MIGILGGMGTQAGLDFCTKLAKINRGKSDQKYPLFVRNGRRFLKPCIPNLLGKTMKCNSSKIMEGLLL